VEKKGKEFPGRPLKGNKPPAKSGKVTPRLRKKPPIAKEKGISQPLRRKPNWPNSFPKGLWFVGNWNT